jgi:CRP-like cAMP-binding protein
MKINTSKCDLNTCFLCQYALKNWHEVIRLNKQNIILKKGEQIFKEGDEVKGIYFIYSGKVKVHKYWDEEKEFIVRFAKDGDILGHMGLGNDNQYPVTATALEQTVVCYLSMDFFEATLAVNTNLTYNLMRFFANELQEKDKKMRNLVHMTVKARIAQSFISLKNQFGVNDLNFINLELTRQDVSAFSGVSYETLFKVMVEFTEQKIIKAVDKSYMILDEEKLIKIVKDDQLRHIIKNRL